MKNIIRIFAPSSRGLCPPVLFMHDSHRQDWLVCFNREYLILPLEGQIETVTSYILNYHEMCQFYGQMIYSTSLSADSSNRTL